MQKNKTINVIIFGIGNVGSELIRQINTATYKLNQEQNIDLKIPIITNSRLAFFKEDTISNSWETDFYSFSVPFKIEEILSYVKDKNLENLIAIDATASQEFVENYTTLAQNGFHIVSANKFGNALNYQFYETFRETLKKNNTHFFYETHVGAGLPIIETVKNLNNSGEEVEKIKGVFSGSLSFIFNEFSKNDIEFSKVVSRATTLGLTEPDAREDLSGNDVARKLLILARELNLKLELSDVNIESLVPNNLNGKTTLHQFKSRIRELDQSFLKLKTSQKANYVLRYIGELNVVSQTLEVKLVSEKTNSTLGNLSGSDALFEIYTKSYGENPIVIQGAGAGKEVTARGLFSDVIKLSNHLN
ncbi:aspartate kinase [Flavobacteriales bacterium 34_180_T64]|nr:aspartate kinase [Flavobacteriales bacterium 34_180_T64]